MVHGSGETGVMASCDIPENTRVLVTGATGFTGSVLTRKLVDAGVRVSAIARHTAELLGLDVLTVANEGKIIIVVSQADADKVISACRGNELGRDGTVIGRFTDAQPGLVELITGVGGRRLVQRPYGEDLPRIC